MGSHDAFAELGLAPGAGEREVKAAWRRLVSRWHPDRNDSAGAVARMQRINQAYEAIRRSGFVGTATDPAAGSADTGPAAAPVDDPRPRRPVRTVQRKVRLTLEEAAAGCTRVLQGRLDEACPGCAGLGHHRPGGACTRCAGSGTLRQRAWYGWFGTAAECEACAGDGLARRPCEACAGTGKAPPRRYRFQVRLPHGVRDGDLLHVDGRRAGADPIALDIRVELQAHPLFELEADGRIRCEIPVDGFAWIAERSIEVPTLDGLQPLALKRDRVSYTLAGRGFPVERRGPRGDQVVTVVPVFPERLSTDQQILFDQLIASRADTDDGRLGDWNRALRAWQRGVPRRDR